VYLLGTSAVLAFYQDEPSAGLVQELFERRDKGDVVLLMSYMRVFELLYLCISRRGLEDAFSLLLTARTLGIEELWPDDDLLWETAQLKSEGGLSAADAFIAAGALIRNATLVHKDPQFDRLSSTVSSLKLRNLPG